jgi:hypothetical protein
MAVAAQISRSVRNNSQAVVYGDLNWSTQHFIFKLVDEVQK